MAAGPLGVQNYSWEYVGSQVARGFSSYSFVVSTTSDSVGGSNPLTGFLVEANAAVSSAFWNSAPDSGYSVDNLPPVAPAPFAGNYTAGAAHLHWGENREPDLAGYRLYRGTSASFVPGLGNRIAAQPDTGFSDAGPAGSFYKLSAVDIHGNESGFALLTPASTTGVEGASLPSMLVLDAPRPNPARDGALLSFALPSAGSVTLAVYDVGGRRVRTVRTGRLEAGEYALPFDLRDRQGLRVPSGLYFVRLDARGQSLVRRLAIVE